MTDKKRVKIKKADFIAVKFPFFSYAQKHRIFYNASMELNIILSIEIFVIDILVWLLIKKMCRLEIKITGLLLSLVVSLASLTSFLFLNNLIFLVLIRLIAAIFIALLITNEYQIRQIFIIFSAYIVLSLSIYGYYEFLLAIFKNLNFAIFESAYSNIIFVVCFAAFYLILYILVILLKKQKSIQDFLADVSFSLGSKHIRLKGLIDSGNHVYDSQTNLPVVLLSFDSLKKFMPLATFAYITDVLSSHYEKCVLVGGKTIYVPIVSVDGCEVSKNGKIRTEKFAIGVVQQKFYDEKRYDCLLHRDFV